VHCAAAEMAAAIRFRASRASTVDSRSRAQYRGSAVARGGLTIDLRHECRIDAA
jgi:hypothetical protein